MIKWPEIQYREEENGMLEPMIEFPKQPEGSVGKYGEMRRTYLKEWKKVLEHPCKVTIKK